MEAALLYLDVEVELEVEEVRTLLGLTHSAW